MAIFGALWINALGGSPMFRGMYEHSVDAKGRLALPASFKKELAKYEGDPQLVITPHIKSPCLVAYPLEEWRAFEERLAARSQFDKHVMALRRRYVGQAMDCAVDKVGRILLPSVLRKLVGIEREVTWVGQLKTIELWTPTAWHEANAALDDEIGPELFDKLSELGI